MDDWMWITLCLGLALGALPAGSESRAWLVQIAGGGTLALQAAKRACQQRYLSFIGVAVASIQIEEARRADRRRALLSRIDQ